MTNHLAVQVVDSPEDAPHYRRDFADVRAASIQKVIVAKNGTVTGQPTVDFQFRDEQGAEFVAMLTGKLVMQLASIIRGASGNG